MFGGNIISSDSENETQSIGGVLSQWGDVWRPWDQREESLRQMKRRSVNNDVGKFKKSRRGCKPCDKCLTR